MAAAEASSGNNSNATFRVSIALMKLLRLPR